MPNYNAIACASAITLAQNISTLNSPNRGWACAYGSIDLAHFVQTLGAKPIITGAETASQLHLAVDAGATLIQGYLFGQPSSAKHLNSSDVIKRQQLV